ncbi:MAG: DUF4215 domain-containing protein [Myxococcota bacterium]
MNYRLLALLLAFGCSSSSTVGTDAGPDTTIIFDLGNLDTNVSDGAPFPDAGDSAVPADGGGPDVGRPPANCGNGDLEGGEQCDDGNTDEGDGCSSACELEPFCGDGEVGGDEVCDDGNNLSGDGCRSDCLSNERCGNGIRDVATGEVCDGEPDCADDCFSLLSCGDGMITAPETCDDSNTDAFDGCGADCQEEQTLVLSALALLGEGEGCDFSGDGVPDNAFSASLGPIVNGFLAGQLNVGVDLIVLLHALGLDDPTMADDDSFTLAWVIGEDADGNDANNLSGSGEFFGDLASFDAVGAPSTSFQAAASGMVVAAGPEDVNIPLGFIPVSLRQSSLTGMSTSDGTRVTGITDGRLCGVVPLSTLTIGLPVDLLGMIPGGDQPPCIDGATLTLADILIGGFGAGIISTPGAPADVDLDADGLEVFELATGAECQPVISACIDGDGTRVEGQDCIFDVRFADGFSAGFSAEAVRATLLGLR